MPGVFAILRFWSKIDRMKNEELKISEMLTCQYELWEKYKDVWPPIEPVDARNSLLWLVEELGEVIAIIKKRGEKDIVKDPSLKEKFTEELVDVFMYFLDVLARYEISGEDFSDAFRKKHAYNMLRDFRKQHKEYLA